MNALSFALRFTRRSNGWIQRREIRSLLPDRPNHLLVWPEDASKVRPASEHTSEQREREAAVLPESRLYRRECREHQRRG